MNQPHKLSSLVGSDFVPFSYPNVWAVQKTTGPVRLIIGPTSDHVDLMTELSRELAEPFRILYVLLVSRRGYARARYQSPFPCPRGEMESFLQEFKEFFERDGRHHIWVSSLTESATLVYDQHNVIYAHGPLLQFEKILAHKGLKRGDVNIPVPHSHNYNPKYDGEEQRLFEYWDWLKSPLMEDDDL